MFFDDRGVVAAEAVTLDAALAAAAEHARSEEDFRIAAVAAIEAVAHRHGLTLDLRAEMAIASGRADAAYNRVVVEFERPGTMRGVLTHGHTAHAVRQTKDYLTGLAGDTGVALTEFAGVATDGHWYVFVRSVGGEWLVDGPFARNEATTARFLRQVLSLGTGRALTTANLVEDFGLESQAAAQTVGALYRAFNLQSDGAALRDALFDEWERLFGAISGADAESMDERARRPLQDLARRSSIEAPQPSRLLFCIHTYEPP